MRASGRCTHSHRSNQVDLRQSRRVFLLTAAKVSQIYDAVDASGLTGWVSRKSGTLDGDRVQLRVTMGRRSHTVLLVNARNTRFDRLIRAINVQLPKAHHVTYNSLLLP